MKNYLIIKTFILAIIAISITLFDSNIAFASDDPFAAIEEEGNKFVDFLLKKVARIVAAIVAFAYIIRFMTTKRFDLNEFMLFGGCIIALGSIGFIVDYFFQ
tara:strand:- start:27220 stop:27525 length:306 start_codon:yes stop_codon:yes gene_type:complete